MEVFLLFQILHFFNTPPQVTEAELIQVFKDYDVVPPKAVKLFPMKSERSSSGLLEFENTTEAVAAVMACNHAAIESPGRKPLSFLLDLTELFKARYTRPPCLLT